MGREGAERKSRRNRIVYRQILSRTLLVPKTACPENTLPQSYLLLRNASAHSFRFGASAVRACVVHAAPCACFPTWRRRVAVCFFRVQKQYPGNSSSGKNGLRDNIFSGQTAFEKWLWEQIVFGTKGRGTKRFRDNMSPAAFLMFATQNAKQPLLLLLNFVIAFAKLQIKLIIFAYSNRLPGEK